MEAPKQFADHCRICAHIFRRPGAGADESGDHHALRGVLDFGCQARGVGSARRHRLAGAVHMVNGIVPAEAHDVDARSIRHLPLSLERPPFSGSAVMAPDQHGSSRMRSGTGFVIFMRCWRD